LDDGGVFIGESITAGSSGLTVVAKTFPDSATVGIDCVITTKFKILCKGD